MLPRDAFDYVWLINPGPYGPEFVAGLTPIWRDGRSVLSRVDNRRPPKVKIDPELLPPRRPMSFPLPSPPPRA